MVGEIYAQEIDKNDSEFLIKQSVINSTSYLHDKTREDRERLYTRIFFAISLALTLLASFYDGDYKWLAFLILMIVLNIMILVSLNDYKKKRKDFWKNRKKMKASFESLGLEWRD